jgi:hypothetical protein
MSESASPSSDIASAFIKLVVSSPLAVVTLVLSWFCGYGISFILFDYRRSDARGSHKWFHSSIGLAYTAVIFIAVNLDILSRSLTPEQIALRMPLTLVVSFALGFPIMLIGAIWRGTAK